MFRENQMKERQKQIYGNWEVVSSVDTQSVQEIYDRSILLDGSNIRGCLFLPTI
jgi:hypothetical protein